VIPEEFLSAVQQRLDIVDVVGSYVSLKKQGRNLTGLCPFHNEKTPSFSVSPEKQIFYCFGCHKGGNALKFLMEIEGLSFPEAVEKAAGMVGLEMPREQSTPQENAEMQRRRQYFKMMSEAASWYQQQLWSDAGRQARQYLEGRGLTAEPVQRFGLGLSEGWDGAVKHLLGMGYELAAVEETGIVSRREGGNGFFDKFHHRLIFPIFDYRGQVVAFGGRIMDSQSNQPKYLNSPETRFFHKSQNLYGLFQAAASIRRQDEAVLMEGYMDVIAAHQFGVDNAVASLGTAFNIEHAKLLKRYTTRVLLSYDGDSAGMNAADKAIDILHEAGFTVRLLTIPEGLDPDEFLRKYGKIAWDKLARERAADFWQYKLNKALRENDVSAVPGKVSVVNALKPYLNACDDPVELESVVNLLAKAVSVAPETIYADLRSKTRVSALQQGAGSRSQENTKSAAKPAAVPKVQANLLLFMLYDKEIYEKTLSELGENFLESAPLQELLSLVQNIKDKYDWQPATLFSYLPEGEAYQLLLRMAQVDIDKKRLPALADGCIRAIKIEGLQKKLALLREELEGADVKRSAELLREISGLELEIRNLRSV
jgi:DNA primase